jgi:hypothetical protein
VGGRLLIRVQRFPSKELIADLNREFSDILADGTFQVSEALPEERRNEPTLNDLPRIICQFNRHGYGRLRAVIDRINAD